MRIPVQLCNIKMDITQLHYKTVSGENYDALRFLLFWKFKYVYVVKSINGCILTLLYLRS